MNNQNIIIFQFNSLYEIMKEIETDINFNIIKISDEKKLEEKILAYQNYLIISKKEKQNSKNQVIFNKLPIKFSKIIERLNIEFLKQKFSYQSQIKINNYTINLNSREIFLNKKKIKLTEKEVKMITYLSQANLPMTAQELQKNVWDYQSNLETHTVETHIYRLRKKFLNSFEDKNFIISEKNGYKIKK
tara:strand:- start:263 stop:829 length:567 start_codon:yes stop_codon:yes gene_type:complete